METKVDGRGLNNAKFTPLEWDAISNRYKQGEAARALSRELGVSMPSVLYQLKKRGIQVRPSREVRKAITENRYVSPDRKLCPQCGKVKPLNEFAKDRYRSDKKLTVCKLCCNARQNNYKVSWTKRDWKANRDRGRRYRQSEGGMAVGRKNSKKFRTTPSSRFSGSKSRAKRVGRTWTISKELFFLLITKCCEYCGGPLPPTSTGLDRLDNKRGYDPDNVVPCCALCNYARRDQFTPDEMRLFIGPAVRAIRKARAEAAAK